MGIADLEAEVTVNFSFYLGGKSPSDNKDWTPNIEAVRATIRFAMATGRLDTNQPQDDYVTVPGSILQLSGDDSTSITKLEGRKGKEEKMTNASRWSLSVQTETMDEKG